MTVAEFRSKPDKVNDRGAVRPPGESTGGPVRRRV